MRQSTLHKNNYVAPRKSLPEGGFFQFAAMTGELFSFDSKLVQCFANNCTKQWSESCRVMVQDLRMVRLGTVNCF